MNKSKFFKYSLFVFWFCLLAFILTFSCVQWGYSSGKSIVFSESLIPEHSQRVQIKLFDLSKQRKQNNDQLVLSGFTYIITYDVKSKSVQVQRLPRYFLNNVEIPDAWERYMYFWGNNDYAQSITQHNISDIVNCVTSVKGTKSKLAAIVAMTVGYLGYNQGKDLGLNESYIQFIDSLDEIWDEEDAEVERFSTPEAWDSLLLLIDSTNK